MIIPRYTFQAWLLGCLGVLGSAGVVRDAAALEGNGAHNSGGKHRHGNHAVNNQLIDVVLKDKERNRCSHATNQDDGLRYSAGRGEYNKTRDHAKGGKSEPIMPAVGFPNVATK